PPRTVGDNGPVRSELWRNDTPAPARGAKRTRERPPIRERIRLGHGTVSEFPPSNNPEERRRVTADRRRKLDQQPWPIDFGRRRARGSKKSVHRAESDFRLGFSG